MSNNNNRLVIKLAGAAGQGIKTAGLIIARALKRSGYMTFGYTEYPSLIRGGHNVFQVEVYDEAITAVSKETDILIALDQASIGLHFEEIPNGGAIIYDENTITIDPELLAKLNTNGIKLFPVKLLEVAKNAGGNVLMKNTVALGSLWKLLGIDLTHVKALIAETYNKSQEMVDLNIKCIEAGFSAVNPESTFGTNLKANPEFANNMIVSGNEAVAMAAIASGVRLYSSYPMTPASAVLTYLAEEGPKYGMVVKQAEDEITSANMVIGAYHGGTRAFCGTSGGGFDLMTEAVSLSGISEIPFVCVIGQRPGPATGVPTWTAQGDLNLALFAGHGDFPRIIVAPGDAEEAFWLTSEAFNLAEKFQTPTLILSDKMLGESNYSVKPYDMSKVVVDRGELVKPDGKEHFRYEVTESGVSPRWFPGDDVSTYLASSDEHTPKGLSTENATEILAMMDKRARKVATIKASLPAPVVYGDVTTAQVKIISWGSNKTTILAAMKSLEKEGIKCSYMHITHMWPLRTEEIVSYLGVNNNAVIFEGNASGQLAHLIKTETGIDIKHKHLKYDGRPFYFEEVVAALKALV